MCIPEADECESIASQCATMSKNDHDKDALSVRCRSGLSDLDLDTYNESKDEGGKFLPANLLEIRLSFQHYRCETLANYLDGPQGTFFSLGGPSTSSTHHNLGSLSKSLPPENHALRLIKSLPSSPPNEQSSLCHSDTSKLLSDSKCNSKAATRFNSSDFHVLLSKIARFKKLNLDTTRPRLSIFQSNQRRKWGKRPCELVLCSPGAIGGGSGGDQCIGATKVESALFATKHVHSQRCAHFCDAAGAESSCSITVEQSVRADPHSSPGFEISSGPATNPVNISPDYSSSSRTASHLAEPPRFEHIPNTQAKHSSSQSFSNISSSYSSLPKDPTQPTIPLVTGCLSPVKYSPLDFRSISEYSFTPNSISHFKKADVCSLPIHMDDEMSSKMLENKAHFGESQRRMPSYVSISRAISGYSNYNQYSSDMRRDNSLLDSLLASRATSRANGDHHAQFDKLSSPLGDDQVDNFCSLPYEPTQEKICLSDPSKSFLQKKIESLYGQTFAEDWRKSRLRSGSPKPVNTPPEKARSPSCPPSRISLDELNSPVAPFQKINSLDNSRENINLNQLSTVEANGERQQSHRGDVLTTGSTATHDGHWFLNLLNQCKADIQVHVDRYETVLASADVIPEEEAIGKIRATIGKANLLINKKLNQFSQLCQDSIVQRENQEFKINSDDLSGFWDMVTIQVEEVNGAFNELDQLRQNNWTAVDDESVQKSATRKSNAKHNTNSPRSLSKLVNPANSPKSSKTASPNGLDRENERKSRLMEIKRRGKMMAREKTAEEEITIFMPNADLDLDK